MSNEHYKKNKLETIVLIETIARPYDGVVAFMVGNVIKYLARAPFKGTMLEDLKKALDYMERIVKYVE